MKKFLVAMAAVIAMTVSINAKDNNPKMFEGLNLTEAQQTQIHELTKNCAEKRKECKDQKQAGRKECKAEMLAQLKTILTPEQYVQFLENSFLNGNNGAPGRAKGQKPANKGQKPVNKACPNQ